LSVKAVGVTWPVTEEMAKTGVTRSEAIDEAAASTWLICRHGGYVRGPAVAEEWNGM
jgi:hypothetical protein